jgi:protein O-GlcNAc transferase
VSNHRLGAALRAQGRAAEALPYMEAAVRLVPRPEHYNGLGNALLDLGRPREALESFERALAAAPRDPLVLFNAANAAYEASDPRAEELYRRSIAADPDFAPARINFGDMLARRHRWTEAADQFREAVRLAPDSPEARNNLGFVLERLGLREEAAGRYREALRLRPGYEDALRNLRRLEG